MLPPQDLLLSSTKDRIFSEKKGEIFIGGEKIKPEFKALLKEQAKYLVTSQLFEVFNETINAEANDLALNKSTEWQHVQFAKALKYYIDVLNTMVSKLSK